MDTDHVGCHAGANLTVHVVKATQDDLSFHGRQNACAVCVFGASCGAGRSFYANLSDQDVPIVSLKFFSFEILGGVSKFWARYVLWRCFRIVTLWLELYLKKTEVQSGVFLGFAILGDIITLLALGVILIGLIGVLLLSYLPKAPSSWLKSILDKGTALGLVSGLMFWFSGNGYCGASLSIADGGVLYRAFVILAFVTTLQTLVMTVWLIWWESGEIMRILLACGLLAWLAMHRWLDHRAGLQLLLCKVSPMSTRLGRLNYCYL